MDELLVGDKVLTAGGVYSKVYSFGHFSREEKTEYIQIQIDTFGTPLEISAQHLIYLYNEKDKLLVPAQDVKVGDLLVAAHDTIAKVLSIRKMHRRGVYSPLTAAGDIVVNGVVASSYVNLSWLNSKVSGQTLHYLQHGATFPYRVYCAAIGGCQEETYDKSTGFSPWVMFWYRLEQWQLGLPNAVQAVILLLLAVPALFTVMVGRMVEELSVWSSVVHFAIVVVGMIVWKKTHTLPLKRGDLKNV